MTAFIVYAIAILVMTVSFGVNLVLLARIRHVNDYEYLLNKEVRGLTSRISNLSKIRDLIECDMNVYSVPCDVVGGFELIDKSFDDGDVKNRKLKLLDQLISRAEHERWVYQEKVLVWLMRAHL